MEAASKAPPPSKDAAPKAAAPAKDGAADAKGGGSGIRDLVLGGGIAFAALGSAVAYIVSALSEVNPLNALIAVVSVVLAIVLLLTFMSWLKLRKRDLSLLFEANGWAVNASQRLSRRLGGRFTVRPKLPKGTKLIFREPAIEGVEPKSRKGLVFAIILALLAAAGGIAYWHMNVHTDQEKAADKNAAAAQDGEAKKSEAAAPAADAPAAAEAAPAPAAPAAE